MKELFDVPQLLNESSTAAQNTTAAEFNLKFNLLYTLYSLPNTVMPLVGGFLVDLIGFRKMVVATTALASLGQLGFTISASYKLWPGMWVSRAFFGIGTESLCVAQRILVAEWFMGRELALAMGVVLAFGRLGSTINDNISALFVSCVDAYWTGFGLCCMSVMSAFAVTYLDYTHETATKASLPPKQWAAFLKVRKQRPRTRCTDIFKLGLPFWLCCGMVLCCFPPVSSFNNISSQLIAARWSTPGHPAKQQAVNAVVGIMYAVSAVLALGMGWVVDKAGTRTLFVCCGSILVAGAHVLIAFDVLPIGVLLGAIGVGFSTLAAAVWPEIAFVAPREAFGMAYGVAGAVQNSGLATVPAIVASLQPPACEGEYACVEWLFCFISLAGASFALMAALLECRRKSDKAKLNAMADETGLLRDFDDDADGWEAGSAGSEPSGAHDIAGGCPSGILAGDGSRPWAGRQRGQSLSRPPGQGAFGGPARSPPGVRSSRVRSVAGAPPPPGLGHGHGHGARSASATTNPQESLGEFLQHSEHRHWDDDDAARGLDPAGAAAAAGGSESNATTDGGGAGSGRRGPRPSTPELISAAIWHYAADVTQHGAQLAERHYRASTDSRQGSVEV